MSRPPFRLTEATRASDPAPATPSPPSSLLPPRAIACALLGGSWVARAAGDPVAEVRSLLAFTPAADLATARLVVDAGRSANFTISRRLFGTFTEHISTNVHQGAWAQLLLNPGCESAGLWGNPPPRPDFRP